MRSWFRAVGICRSGRGVDGQKHPGDRPGHHQHAGHRVRRTACRRQRRARVRPALPAARLGRARSRGNLAGRRRCREALAAPISTRQIAGIGITNQRETTCCGSAHGPTRAPGHRLAGPAHRRALRELKATATRPFRERTGLVLDPYFSATKLAWLLDHVPDARERAEAASSRSAPSTASSSAACTGGLHATDVTNASRTLLFDIRRLTGTTSYCGFCASRARCCPK